MAGRPRIIKSIKSYINHIDAHTASGPMKMGTSPSVGVIKYYWHNYQSNCNQTAGKPKKSYDNMVFLNINPAITPVSAGFPQSQQGLFNNYPGRAQALSTYQGKMFAPGRMARFYYNKALLPGFSQQKPQYYSAQTVVGVNRSLY